MAKCIICGGALWHTDRCPMRDHEISTWEEMRDKASRPIGPIMKAMMEMGGGMMPRLEGELRSQVVGEWSADRYDPCVEKLKDKMRRGIIWTGWLDAAKRNKKQNG